MELFIALGLFIGLILAWLRLPATAMESEPAIAPESPAPTLGDTVTA